MHPKNSHRTDAIRENTYQELTSSEDAIAFINSLIEHNLRAELLSIESSLKGKLSTVQQMKDIKLVLDAPDQYLAAAALIQNNFFNGKGDRTQLFRAILESDPRNIRDLGAKLLLTTKREFMGHKIYNDKLCQTMEVHQQTVYRLWLHLCRRHQVVTLQEMIEFAPYQAERLRIWDRHVDTNGKTTLNMEEYMAFRQKCAEKAKILKEQKKAEK